MASFTSKVATAVLVLVACFQVATAANANGLAIVGAGFGRLRGGALEESSSSSVVDKDTKRVVKVFQKPARSESTDWGGEGRQVGGQTRSWRRRGRRGLLENLLHLVQVGVSRTMRLAVVLPLQCATDAARVPVELLPPAVSSLAGAHVPLRALHLLSRPNTPVPKTIHMGVKQVLLPARLVWFGVGKVVSPLCWVVMKGCVEVNKQILWRGIKTLAAIGSGSVGGSVRLTAVCAVSLKRGLAKAVEGGARLGGAGRNTLAFLVGGIYKSVHLVSEFTMAKPIRATSALVSSAGAFVSTRKTGRSHRPRFGEEGHAKIQASEHKAQARSGSSPAKTSPAMKEPILERERRETRATSPPLGPEGALICAHSRLQRQCKDCKREAEEMQEDSAAYSVLATKDAGHSGNQALSHGDNANAVPRPESDFVLGSDITQRFEVEGPPTEEGQRLAIIGSHEKLGNWQVGKALSLLPAFNIQEKKRVWSLSVRLPAGETMEYKYVLLTGDGSALWEGLLHNRVLTVGSPKVQLDAIESFMMPDQTFDQY